MTAEMVFFILIILILSISLLWLLFYFNRQWMRQQSVFNNRMMKALSADIRKEGFKTMLPLRIQAGERMVLFLERLQPQQVINRYLEEKPANSAAFSQLMLQGIREEFEYNLSQQLFLSDTAWQLTKAAKEEVVHLIHLSKTALDDDSPAHLLAGEIISHEAVLIAKAIGQIKADLDKLTL